METNVNERIKLIIDSNSLNYHSFSKLIGVTNSTITSMFEKGTKPSYDLLIKILNVYTNINTEWLLKGVGTMTKGKIGENKHFELSNEKLQFSVPLIPFEAIAGFTNHDNEGIGIEKCERYFVPEFNEKGVEFLVRVSGSSMYPKYSNGDMLACRKIAELLFFQWGKVYVIDSSQGVMIKRIYEDKDDIQNISCVSDNKDHYPPFSIPKSDIRSLSMVLGVIRTE